MTILPSIGAFIGRVNGRDHRAFLSVADRIDASAFEFMMYESFYPRADAILDDFCATGLDFPVFHVEKRLSEYIATGEKADLSEAYSRFSVNCRAAARLGAGIDRRLKGRAAEGFTVRDRSEIENRKHKRSPFGKFIVFIISYPRAPVNRKTAGYHLLVWGIPLFQSVFSSFLCKSPTICPDKKTVRSE